MLKDPELSRHGLRETFREIPPIPEYSHTGPHGLCPLLRSSSASLSHVNYCSHSYMGLLSDLPLIMGSRE